MASLSRNSYRSVEIDDNGRETFDDCDSNEDDSSDSASNICHTTDDGAESTTPPRKSTEVLAESESCISDSRPSTAKSQFSEKAVRKQPISTLKFLLRCWWIESICCLLVVGSLIGLIVTLTVHQRRPLPEWPYSLTINSIISLFILVFRSSALVVICEGISQLKWSWFSTTRCLNDITTYDNASRGPWGALILMWKLKHRHVSSSLAALIMLSSLALDPLAQQLIKFNSCDNPLPRSDLNTPALFPRTQFWGRTQSMIPEQLWGKEKAAVAQQTFIPSDVLIAIQSGLYVKGAVPIQWQCPTGRCESDQKYGTLGWETQCDEVSKELTFQTISPTTQTGKAYVKAILPSQAFAHTMNATDVAMILSTQSTSDALQSTTEFIYISPDYADRPRQVTLGRYKCGHVTCPENRTDSDIWCCRGFGAVRCRSNIFARDLESTVVNGLLNETEQSKTSTWHSFDGMHHSAVRLDCLTTQQRQKLIDFGYDIKPGMSWTPFNGTAAYDEQTRASGSDGVVYQPYSWSYGRVNTTYSRKWSDWTLEHDLGNTTEENVASVVPPDCIYGFSNNATLQTHAYLKSVIDGQAFVNVDPNPMTIAGSDALRKLVDADVIESRNITKFYNDATGALDRHLRQNGALGSLEVGTVYAQSTCLEVRWPWIVLPSLLTILLLVFFVALILETTIGRSKIGSSQPHDFKGSPLALLFHGMDHKILADLDDRSALNEKQDLERLAKTMNVRFAQSRDGWKFSDESVPLLDHDRVSL